MTRTIRTMGAAALMATFTLVAGPLCAADRQSEKLAKEILDATGVKGGLVVHIGCGDGRLTAALGAKDCYVVEGLDGDPANIQRARQRIQSLGLYGRVTIQQWHGDRLPYVDNLVNLVVWETPGVLSAAEVRRVLAPGGVAYIKVGRKWKKSVKPRPEEIDEWTHDLHDATNNAVAHDSVIGPPRHMQWVGSPKWARHHDHMASMSALVSSAGRIFYIFDEGPTSAIELPPKWTLIARDAFSGVVLWKRPIQRWHTYLWPLKSGPAQLPRRLVAVGDTVYVTLGIDAPLTALDAATGKTVRTYKGTKTTDEVILSDGVLFVLVNDSAPTETDLEAGYKTIQDIRTDARDRAWNAPPRSIVAIRADTGETLWRKPHTVVPLTLAADDQRVFFHDGKKIVCLDRATGEQLWASAPLAVWSTIRTYYAPTLVVYKDVVLFAGGDTMVPHRGADDTMTALSVQTGKTLWAAEHPPSGYQSPEDILVAGGLVWCGATTNGSYSGIFTGRDPLTGDVKSQFPPDVETYWFHHRCYRGKATDKYLLMSRTGIEFIDTKEKHWIANHWVRGGCLYGIMPCNGLIYAPPHSCACYMEAKQNGFNVLAPDSPTRRPRRDVPDVERIQRGSAYGKPVPDESAASAEGDWPTYRHDATRNGVTKVSVPVDLKPAWQSELGGNLTSVVVARGKLFVASVDTHTLYALDESSGETLWTYTADGRIDSPPTIYQGRALFGSADGWVYCLRADDGALIWRFRAAPEDWKLMAFEQLESVWPVHGSVLVEGDALYCVAGRSMFLDGGLRLLRLDPKTGRKLSETILDDKDPETGENLQMYVKGLNMTVALPDVLSSDGRNVYMRSLPFTLDGKRERLAYVDVKQQQGADDHLFSPIGFLDGSWWHRGYWVYGRTMASGAGGYYLAGRVAPAGRILAVDDSFVYGYGRKPQYFRWTTPLEYHLFATSKQLPAVQPAPRRPGGSCVGVERSASLTPAGKPLTVEAWAKADTGNGVVVARGGDAHGYALYLKDGKPQFAIRVSNEMHVVGADQNVVGKWVHLAGVLTADKKLQIYVNGKLSGSADAGGFIASDPAQAMEIGADEGGSVGDYQSPFGLKGVIDEVKVYHRALSAAEIQQEYSAPDQKPAKDEALVIYFSFDKGDAADESGNKNDGELQGVKAVKGKFGGAMRFKGARRRGMPTIPFAVKFDWSEDVPLQARAMVLADRTLFVAGPPDVLDEEAASRNISDAEIRAKLAEQAAALQGKEGALLWAVSAANGEKLAELKLQSVPRWDGMIAANGRLYISTTDGKVLCLAGA